MAYYKNFSENKKNIIEEVKRIPIIKYASIIGYTPIKIGNYYTLKEADSVRIDTEKNCFFRNSNGANGSIIDFAMEFENKDIKDVIQELSSLAGLSEIETEPVYFKPQKEKQEVTFELPKRTKDIKNVYAYLVNTRRIDKDIVNDFIRNKNLYQDEHKNCVFVSYNKDGQPDFANKRGSNTHKRFVADVPGSNYNNCFFINNNADTLVITESVIDAMSVMTITKQNGGNYKNFNYLALSGTTKYPAIQNQLKQNPNINKIILALDNDNAGKTACINIQADLKDWNGKIIEHLPTKAKDWNAQLCTEKKQKDVCFKKNNFSLNKEEIEKEL